MERLGNNKKTGINGNALRTWGLLFLAAGVIGRGIIQAHMLGIAGVSGQQMLEALSASDQAMTMATVSIALQALECCAVPIFALLLVNGMVHTSDVKAYFLRVAGLALICEIPYNLAMQAKFFALSSRNPVFGIVICMIMLCVYRYYSQKKAANIFVKLLVTVAALAWCEMLKIDAGSPMVILTAVLWAYRNKPLYRNFAGAAAAIACSVISPYYLASPMGFMAIHFYNEEKGTNSRQVNYLAYPAILLAATAMGILL